MTVGVVSTSFVMLLDFHCAIYFNNFTLRSGFASEEPISIPTCLKNNAKDVPDLPALKTKDPKTGDEVNKHPHFAYFHFI